MLRHLSMRSALARSAIAGAILLVAGCSSIINPHVTWEPKNSVKDWSLKAAMEYADDAKKAYKKALGEYAQANYLLGASLLPIGGAAAGLGVTGGSSTLVAGLGAAGATLFGFNQWSTSKPRQKIYIEGMEAMGCAVEAMLPLYFDQAEIDDFNGQLPELGKALETLLTRIHTVEEAAKTFKSVAISEGFTAETARETAEAALKTAEAALETAEAALKTAEAALKTAEAALKTAETARERVETARETAETARETAETARQTAEMARETAETAPETAETALKTAETAKLQHDSAYKTYKAGLALNRRLTQAGRALKEAVDRIGAQVDKALLAVQPDPSEIKKILAGLADMSAQIGGRPVAPAVAPPQLAPADITRAQFLDEGTTSEAALALGELKSAVDLLTETSDKVKEAESSVANMVNSVNGRQVETNLAKCDVESVRIKIVPEGDIVFNIAAAGNAELNQTKRLAISGGRPSYYAYVLDPDGTKLDATSRPAGGTDFVHVTAQAQPARDYTVYITDSAGNRKEVKIEIRNPTPTQ